MMVEALSDYIKPMKNTLGVIRLLLRSCMYFVCALEVISISQLYDSCATTPTGVHDDNTCGKVH